MIELFFKQNQNQLILLQITNYSESTERIHKWQHFRGYATSSFMLSFGEVIARINGNNVKRVIGFLIIF